jgi:hypothetical protein
MAIIASFKKENRFDCSALKSNYGSSTFCGRDAPTYVVESPPSISAHSAITWRHEPVNKLATGVSVPTPGQKLILVITLLRWPTVTGLITTPSLQNGGLGKSLSRIFQF